ncbi:MAG: 2,3-bisphosphoglycerate-independent phosphoglycerate mutase [bacterium]|nr:2,3-bisphosphoglycerate-independent phosphoglycerate mutase [bacterium]
MPHEARIPGPVVLVIRDGWGHNPHAELDRFNAIKLAHTPVADQLMDRWPTTLIKTSGEEVGLPAGTMGNSEVGHQSIGAGRIVDQEGMRITRAIRDGSFFDNPALTGAFDHACTTAGKVHLIGLVSDAKVHSDIEHLFALIDLAAQQRFAPELLLVHAVTDGRNPGAATGLDFIDEIEHKLKSAGAGRIASVHGRYYAMDRDSRWSRIALSFAALTGGPAPTAAGAIAAVSRYYENPTDSSRTGDEFIVPTRIVDPSSGEPPATIASGDAVIFFNYRGDRPREITKAFVLDDAAWAGVKNGGFDRGPRLNDLYYCTMTGYEQGLPASAIAFDKPPPMANNLGRVLSDHGLTQFRCAESEKYPHVTFFFNDYRDDPFPGENRRLLPSPTDVGTYDQKPQMAAEEVCDAVVERVVDDDCEPLIVVNFANPDVVGHTAKLDAIRAAIEVVDRCVGRIVEAVLARSGALVITADHGNAEQTWDPENDRPHTAHTAYDVPLIIAGEPYRGRALREGGRLADVAPTLLRMLDIEPPAEMTGRSLVD